MPSAARPLAALLLLASSLPAALTPASAYASPWSVLPAAGASAAQDPGLKDQQMEYAKQMFGEAEQLIAAGDFVGALAKYETAYQYAPEFHALNYNIGLAAFEAGQCAKAKQAFQRFLDLVAESEFRKEATLKILEIERGNCKDTAPAVAPVVTPTTTPTTEEDPLAAKPESKDPEDGDEGKGKGRKDRDADPSAKKYLWNPLMIGGVVGMGVGGAALVTGAALLGVASARAQSLADDASSDTPTSFPSATYTGDVFDRDQSLAPLSGAGIALLAVGIAGAGAGAAVYFVGLKKCKAQAKAAAVPRRVQLAALGAAPIAGGMAVGATFAMGRGAPAPRVSERCR